jgi:hypothetical protein
MTILDKETPMAVPEVTPDLGGQLIELAQACRVLEMEGMAKGSACRPARGVSQRHARACHTHGTARS